MSRATRTVLYVSDLVETANTLLFTYSVTLALSLSWEWMEQ